jgi:MoaA/NifB/PqqE/SkfB family radical SAM enzyme
MWERIRLALARKANLTRPIQLIVFVTDRCNARCGHCFNWRALNQGDEGPTLDELQTLSADLGQLLTMGISGGEPFLRHDLASVYGIFAYSNGLGEIDVPTNGLLPEHIYDTVREMLAQDSPTLVAISLSLDGLEETHDRIRGVAGSFAKLHTTYQRLVDLKKEMPEAPLLIKVATTLCNWNIGEIPALIAHVRQEMPAVDFHNFEIMRGEPKDDKIGRPALADLEDLKPHIIQAWKSYAFYGRRHRLQSWLALGLKRYILDLYIEMLRQEAQIIPCYAARTSAVVDARSNVYFCELREPIGNLHDAPLLELWHSAEAERIRASIERGECYCVHSCFQQKNVFLNPRLWPYVILHLLTGKFTVPAPSHIQPRSTEVKPGRQRGSDRVHPTLDKDRSD